MKLDETKAKYNEILAIIGENPELVAFNASELKEKADDHLYKIELKEVYGLDTRRKLRGRSWNELREHIVLATFGDRHNRTIVWPDDDRRPLDTEVLLCISFPTGAYIFGDDYPVETFREFFSELKSYGPKYSDTHNKSLYYSLGNCAKVFNDFDAILEKYTGKYKEEMKARRIKKLESTLEKLKSEVDK